MRRTAYLGPMLPALHQRILGVLIEKELAVPDSYPLTEANLLAGCNQKSNRDPQMRVEEYEIEGALRALMDRDWVVRHERDGGRVVRYVGTSFITRALSRPSNSIA